jgi:cellulose synthase/poly-beta-1,6-N-acetylglucosamine synthase-like glycosyltransferase
MSALLNLSLVINAFLLLMALINAFTIIRPKKKSEAAFGFSLLVPCRNEEENIVELVKYLGALDHPRYEVIFINDNSTDSTGQLLREAIKNRSTMSVIDAQPLPHGWLGKPWALSQGLASARYEYVVTIDADVRLRSDALSAVDSVLARTNTDFLSPYPAQIALTLSERLIQPLLQWTWMTTVPLRLAMKSKRRSLAVANGQFFIIRKSALIATGGFEAIRSSVLDDIDMARALIAAGFCGGVCDGSSIASTRMYSSFRQIRAGYGKSLAKGFGGTGGSIAIATLTFISGLLPFIGALGGSSIATASLLLVIASRMISALSSRSLMVDALLHPISTVVFIYLLAYSNLSRGKITWKGRAV